ncbi:MAG: aspartate carbamoyltransferase catalytic subunit [Pseudomonadota bacterium]|nr:aspartate carbamoyltransferase catalytic subunit [Pseudomonadota bacterium]
MNILSVDQFSHEDVARILDRGKHWLAHIRTGDRLDGAGPLEGRSVVNLFFENSTRTLLSFSLAAGRLGAFVTSLPVANSSVNKGESLADTATTIGAMRPDVLVIRHPDNGAPAEIEKWVSCPVVNAGDGTNEHPTQALLDAATIRHRFGRFDGLKVAICGDIKHSRVARSNAKLLPRLGAEVRLAGPPSLIPDDLPEAMSVDDAIAGADVVMMLRVQRERMSEALGDAPGEYLARYGLTRQRLNRAAPNVAVMHPGPMNRGVEIDGEIADDSRRSVIPLQVEIGVAIRMTCLEMIAGTVA